MLSDAKTENPVFDRTGVLVVCPSPMHHMVQRYISRHAARGWENSLNIALISIPHDRVKDKLFVTSEINRIASRLRRDLRLLSLRPVCFDQTRLRPEILTTPADQELTPNSFERSRLPNALRGLRLDWRASLADSLANAWDHGRVDEARIDAWLKQFETLQSHRWIGERLLQVLDFWPSARIRDGLKLTSEVIGNYSHICVNRLQPGKSADPLANKIQKRLNEFTSMRVSDLYEVLSRQEASNILYVEDCLLTGTEITSLLRALLGNSTPGRSPKTPALESQALLRDKAIVMHFLVTTNMGGEILKQFLAENGINNVQINKSDDEVITLTPLGVQALREGNLFDEDKCLRQPSEYIKAVAFQETLIWGDQERVERAISFCRDVGEQLFRHYLVAKEWTWSEKRIRESSLGVRSSALALAFAHSVPKATLPLFWMEGTVKLDNKEIRWCPLFPSAA